MKDITKIGFIFLLLLSYTDLFGSRRYRANSYNFNGPCNNYNQFCSTWCKDIPCNGKACIKRCPFFCLCCNVPYCGPYPRPLPGFYDSFKDNTRIRFWMCPECAPRNESLAKGYLYKGMWWDDKGVRYWAIRNSTDDIITVEALAGGEMKRIPVGDVVNINRGESYAFRIEAPTRQFELFKSDAHHIEVFINNIGDIDYKEVQPEVKTARVAPAKAQEVIVPKF